MNENKTVNTQRLAVGETYRNYKELCAVLEEELNGGNAKKMQIKNWEYYFDFYKEGQKFIVVDIYDKPLTKELHNNRTIYAQNITGMLLLMLQESQGEDIIITRKDLMLKLGMVNEKYKQKSLNKDCSLNFPTSHSQDYHLTQFFNNSYKKLNSILNSTFESLNKRELTEINTNMYMVKFEDEDYKIANQQERDIIGTTIYNVCGQFGFRSEQDSYFSPLVKEFRDAVAEELKYKYNISGVYKAIRLHARSIDTINVEINLKEQQNELNSKVLSKLKEMNQKIYNKQYSLKYDSDFGEQEIFMYDIDFVEKQDILTDYFIDSCSCDNTYYD